MGLVQVERILRARSIALDANLFIYAIEGHPSFPQVATLFKKLSASKAKVITSILTVLEVTTPLFREGQKHKIIKYLDFISGQGTIAVMAVDKSIALKAAELRAKYGLNTPDAIHLATAVTCGAQIFVTADRDYRMRSIEGLKIETLLPVERPAR